MWQKFGLTLVVMGHLVSTPCWAQEEVQSGPTLTYDLGASTGSLNDSRYVEAQLGLNWFVQDWLIWRNAGFYRSVSSAEDYFGLDTSIRLRAQVGDGPLSLQVFGGPGLRFPSFGPVAPLAEGGLIVGLGGLRIGGGVRVIFNEWIAERGSEAAVNDVMYFLILSGGGIL